MKPLCTTFSETKEDKICKRGCCEGKDQKVAYRWRWRGGPPPCNNSWLYVCIECHVDILEQTLDEAKEEAK